MGQKCCNGGIFVPPWSFAFIFNASLRKDEGATKTTRPIPGLHFPSEELSERPVPLSRLEAEIKASFKSCSLCLSFNSCFGYLWEFSGGFPKQASVVPKSASSIDVQISDVLQIRNSTSMTTYPQKKVSNLSTTWGALLQGPICQIPMTKSFNQRVSNAWNPLSFGVGFQKIGAMTNATEWREDAELLNRISWELLAANSTTGLQPRFERVARLGVPLRDPLKPFWIS